MHKHKRTKKAIVWLLTLAMALSLVPVLGGEAATAAHPEDLTRHAAYTAAQGNIARLGTVNSGYTNGGARTLVNDGGLTAGTVHNTWSNNNGNTARLALTWTQPYTITAMRVMWEIHTDTGLNWPSRAHVEYNSGATIAVNNTVGATNTVNLANAQWVQAGTPVGNTFAIASGSNVGVDGNINGGTANRPSPGRPSGQWNTRWNVVIFDPPITTTQLRLTAIHSGTGNTPGIGIQEWEVFGEEPVYDPEVVVARALQDLNVPASATSNLTLPATGYQGAAITWATSDADVISAAGVVTRPAWDTADATVTLTATATYEEESGTRDFIVTVPKMPSPQELLDSDLAAINLGNLVNRVTNITLPATGAQGTAFAWASSNPDVVSTAGVVTRPAHDEEDANVTLTVTGTRDAISGTRDFQVSVPKMPTPSQLLAEAVAALTLGNTGAVVANLTLPAAGLNGTTIAWSSSNTVNLMDNGTVLRPPSGANATAVLTAVISLGDLIDTKTFNVTINAYTPGGRAISNVKWSQDGADLIDDVIEVPRGSAPKLPYRVWVEYTDGYGEWRNTKWPWQAGSTSGTNNTGIVNGPPASGSWSPSNVETTWKGYAVGRNYNVTGWITGTGSDSLGYPITVACTVIDTAEWRDKYVPSNHVEADTPPLGKVTLTGQNRLTSNATRAIATIAGYSPQTYLWNYRNHFGYQSETGQETNPASPLVRLTGVPSGTWQSPRGTAPSGWENETTRLRGHGAGHYLSSLAIAYASNLATTSQRNTLRSNMMTMVGEMRKLQLLTIVPVADDHPNSYAKGGTGFLESSNIWPYNAADQADNAPTWPFATLSTIMAGSAPPSNFRTQENRRPEWFGYGYLNAIPPLHPAMNESYGSYSSWLWAPYYGWHKQLAGLMEIYDLWKNSSDAAEKSTAYTALQVCADMSRWISERLTAKGYILPSTSRPTRNATAVSPYYSTTYGQMAYTWSTNISGEYGGANESIARCAQAVEFELAANNPLFAEYAGEFKVYPKSTTNPGSDAINKKDHDGNGIFSIQDLLVSGSEMFRNSTYWDPLAVNSEIMSLNGNSHANSRIPNFPGVLWSYRGNADPEYWLMAKNHLDFNAGRYRYYGGNVSVGEWYRTPYTQINTMGSSNINETCCAYNLARLAKDLACFEPDNAEYVDYYERLTYNQLVGSLSQSSWGTTYQYAVGPNQGKSFGSNTPGSTCCGGTGTENHLRYADALYLINDSTVWLNMYMPSTLDYDNAGVRLTQDCVWPAETSTITAAALAGQTAKPFDLKVRVPWWATRGFDVKLNGVSVASSYEPSSFVTIPGFTTSDVIVVDCPFIESIDYGPDRYNNTWAGTIFCGPLAMTGTGAWSTINVQSNLTNIVKNPVQNLANTSSSTPGNNSFLYTMSVTGTQPTTNANTLQPDYYRNTAATKYFMINLLGAGELDKTALFNLIQESLGYIAMGADYTVDSLEVLQSVLNLAIPAYQNASLTLVLMNTQIANLQEAIDNLDEAGDPDKTVLETLINTGLSRIEAQEAWLLANDDRPSYPDHPETADDKPWAKYAYARMVAALPAAQAELASETSTNRTVRSAAAAFELFLNDMVIGNQYEVEDLEESGLNAMIAEAELKQAALYTEESFAVLATALEAAIETHMAISAGTSTSGALPNNLRELRAALDELEELVNPWGYLYDDLALYYIFDENEKGEDNNIVRNYAPTGDKFDSIIQGTDPTEEQWDENGFNFLGTSNTINNWIAVVGTPGTATSYVNAADGLINRDMTVIVGAARTGDMGTVEGMFLNAKEVNSGGGFRIQGLNVQHDGTSNVGTWGVGVNAYNSVWPEEDESVDLAYSVKTSAEGANTGFTAIDGVKTSGSVSPNAISITTPVPFLIGRMTGSASNYFNNIRFNKYMVFNRDLNEEEVKAISDGALAPVAVIFEDDDNAAISAVRADGSELASGFFAIKGTPVTFTAEPAEDYRLVAWFVNGELQVGERDNVLVIEPMGDVTVTAEFHICTFVPVVTKPTCLEEGFTTFTCSCGDSYVGNEVPALGHNYVGKITTYPDFINVGLMTLTCSRCKDKYTEAIPVLIPADKAFLSSVAANVLKKGLDPDTELYLVGKVLWLVIDGRGIILSTNANNRNVSGSVAISGGGTLTFDLKGNGSNIKTFTVK